MLESIFILIVLCVVVFNSLRRPHNFPKGPPVYPVFGNIFHMDMKNPNLCIKRLHRKYGNVGIIVPFYKIVFLKDADLINELLLSDHFSSRPDVSFNRDRFGGKNLGLMFSHGNLWQANKRLTLQFFRNFGMGKKTQEFIIQEEAESLLKDIDSFNGKPFQIEDLFYLSNINITWTLLGGRRFDHSDPDLAKLGHSLNFVTHQFSILGGVTTHAPFLRHLFPRLTGHTEYMEHNGVIMSFVKNVIHSHKKTRDVDNPRDLIDSYLNEIENQEDSSEDYINERQLEAICADALVGGADTGSGTLAFAALFLCIHQNIQNKMVEEITKHVGLVHLPTSSDRPNLVYCQAVINEVLRFRPSTPIILAHRATENTKLGPYDIPKDVLVFPHIEESFFDKELWGDPEVFRPERFITEEGKLNIPDILVPFGKGKRGCPGEGQARLVLFMLLSSIVQRFSLAFAEGEPIPSTEGTHRFLLAPPQYNLVATPR